MRKDMAHDVPVSGTHMLNKVKSAKFRSKRASKPFYRQTDRRKPTKPTK